MIRDRRTGRLARLALVAALTTGAAGCTDWAGYDLDSFFGTIPVLSTMRGSVAYDAHEMPRLPAEGSVAAAGPLGAVPPSFAQTQLDSAAATLTSPFGAQPAADVLARGEVVYLNQCSVCHGVQGAGDGTIVGGGRFPFAPPINGAATAARSDGYLYAVVVAGRGLMPAYGSRLTEQDRWAVVAYTRQLQGGTPPAPMAIPVDAGTTAAPAQGTPAAPPATATDTVPQQPGR